MDRSALKALIAERARIEGFSACGFCAPDAIPEAAGRLAAYVAAGRHGQMGWMAERMSWRGDPAALWPEARTVIMLAEAYAPDYDPLAVLGRKDRAAVSCYAQGKDYHDIDNFGSSQFYYYIEGDKVYKHYNCERPDELLYDFGLEIGDTIQSGYYKQYVLASKEPITFLNGDDGTKFTLKKGNASTVWISGFGRLGYGNGLEFYKLICVKLNGALLYEQTLPTWLDTLEIIDCDYLTCVRPKPNFSARIVDNEVTFDNTTKYGDQYFWNFGDGTSSTEKSPRHTYQHEGCYTVSLKVTNACFPEGYTLKSNLAMCSEEGFTISDSIQQSAYSSFRNVNGKLLFYTFGTTLYKSVDPVSTKAGDEFMTSILVGVVKGSDTTQLKVDGIDGRTTAYSKGGMVYIRTPYTMLSPAWSSSVQSGDGTKVYALN